VILVFKELRHTAASWARPLVVVAGFFLSAIVITELGLIDSWARDGSVSRTVTGFLFSYWAIVSLLVLLARHWRERRRQIVLLVASSVLTMFALELGLRIVFHGRPLTKFHGVMSAELHHIYPANRRMYLNSFRGPSLTVETNEHGLRSRYSREEFLDYETRIVLMGDSFVFGPQVEQDETVARVLELRLRRELNRNDVAVLNAGVISYSPFLEGHLFRGRIRDYEPTLVILLLDVTDIGDDFKYSAEARSTGGATLFAAVGKRPSRLMFRSALYNLALPYSKNLVEYLEYPLEFAQKKPTYDYYDFHYMFDGIEETNRFFVYRHPLDKTRSFFESTLENINELAGQVEQAGGDFLLAISPRFHHWNTEECPDNWEKGSYALDEPHQFEYFRFFEESRSAVDYPILNLLPAFQLTDEFPLVFESDPHWNVRGHAFVAKVLADAVVQEKLIRLD